MAGGRFGAMDILHAALQYFAARRAGSERMATGRLLGQQGHLMTQLFRYCARLAARPLPAIRAAGLAAAIMAGSLSFPVPTSAQEFDPLLDVRIAEAVQQGDTDGALALIDGALAGADDYRLTEDLLSRKATIQKDAGRAANALATYRALEAALTERLGETAPELVPVLDQIAKLSVAAGAAGDAAAALGRILDILLAAGRREQAEPYLARLEELAGQRDAAAAARADAIIRQFREASEETSRGPFAVDPEQGYSTVKIYYATDRARSGSDEPEAFYGGERGTLELGTAEVSIPPRHMPGKIERPSIWTLEFREDPGRHIVLKSVTPGDSDTVFGEMRGQLAESGADSAFVFVHGFNVPFAEAAQRTAQMAYDMNFDGLPILYSWPSRGSLLSYIADTAVVNFSGRRLTLFLEDLVAKSGAKRIHLIAHSMGNRALTDALELYALRHRGEEPAFDQVLFTAPDLDAGLFSVMVETIRSAARRITLYASDRDWALAVSRKLHGDAARAGQGGRNIVHAAAVDSIDMTPIGDDMLAHSYYANNPSALTDILSLFWRDAPPEARCGMVRTAGENGDYWQYTPEECDSNALLSTLSFLRRASIVTFPEARSFMNRFVMPATADPDERSRLETALARLFRD